MNKNTLLCSLVVAVLLGIIWRDQTKLDDMAQELERLKSRQAEVPKPTPSSPAKADPELQAKCAAKSKVFFDQWLRDAPHYRKPGIESAFTDHYDPASRSCYMEILVNGIRVGAEFATSKFVFDAYEGSLLADYSWVSHAGRKYWEVKPQMCHVKGRDDKDNYCDSDDGFKQMVRERYGVTE